MTGKFHDLLVLPNFYKGWAGRSDANFKACKTLGLHNMNSEMKCCLFQGSDVGIEQSEDLLKCT